MSSRKLSGFSGYSVRLLEVAVLVNVAPDWLDIVWYTLAMALPSVVISAEMALLGIGFLVRGKKSCAWPAKLPESSALVGTVTRVGFCCWRRRFHSSPRKKKSLSFLITPPRS